MKKYLFLFVAIVLIGCTGKDLKSLNLDRIDLQGATMLEDIYFDIDLDSVEYILLEMTPNGKSAISNILDYCITDDYVFIHSSKKDGILQFGRSGNFIRYFAEKGGGPGETISISSISANEEKNELYISQLSAILVYDFDGNYLRTIKNSRLTSCQYYLNDNLLVEVGQLFFPINYQGMIGFGIFDLNGDTIGIRNDFVNDEILSADLTGITAFYLISGLDNNYLSYISLSDTIFSLSSDGVEPMYVINTGKTNEMKKELFHYRSDNTIENNFAILDFFEIDNLLYIRALYNEKIYIYSYNKKTKQTIGMCSKSNPFKLMKYNRSLTLIGLKGSSNMNIPIWISKVYWNKKMLVQFNTSSEILYLRENGKLNEQEEGLENINEDSNPLIIIYHLK